MFITCVSPDSYLLRRMKGGKCDTIVSNWMTQFKYQTGKKCLKPPLEAFSFEMELILKPSSIQQIGKNFWSRYFQNILWHVIRSFFYRMTKTSTLVFFVILADLTQINLIQQQSILNQPKYCHLDYNPFLSFKLAF